MPLSSLQLDAFFAVAATTSFSKAAARLRVTQPALSQRIRNLETELGLRLFVRAHTGVRVTEAGARLLRYCQAQRALEHELLGDLAADVTGSGKGLSGCVRLAGFSSVVRSCVLPALAALLRQNPRLDLEVTVGSLQRVETQLLAGSVDFAILDHLVDRPEIEHTLLGREHLVFVESASHRARDEVYLDHDPEDGTTLGALRLAGKQPRHVRRAFLGDIYGVLDGAALGLGRAVVPRHLVAAAPAELRIVKGLKAPRTPVILHAFRQAVSTRAHDAVRATLLTGVPPRLAYRASGPPSGAVPRRGRARSRDAPA